MNLLSKSESIVRVGRGMGRCPRPRRPPWRDSPAFWQQQKHLAKKSSQFFLESHEQGYIFL
jgi:hypothetical protein